MSLARSILKIPRPGMQFYLLNISALIIYFTILSQLKTGVSETIMFCTPDSVSYMDVAGWIESGEETESLSKRPFLFPALILVFYKIGGVVGIWLMNLFFWLITVNLVYFSIYHLTRKISLSALGAVLILSNVSLISITQHALTESTTAGVLSLLAYFIIRNYRSSGSLYFIHGIILFLVLLTVVKPVFYLPLLFAIFIVLPVFYFRKYMETPRRLFLLLCIMIPLFVQLSIMKLNYDRFIVSEIGRITLSEYLVAQGIEKSEKVSRDEAIKIANGMSPAEQRSLILKNKSLFMSVFISNLVTNIRSVPTLLIYPAGYENIGLMNYMVSVNKIYYKLHLIFLFVLFILSLDFILRKKYQELLMLMVLAALASYYIVTTGISSWQGDRLVLPAIAVWSVLYSSMIYYLVIRLLEIRANRNLKK